MKREIRFRLLLSVVFNLGGTDTNGKSFKKTVNVSKGNVQALWIGSDVPVTASGVYKGKVTIKAADAKPVEIACELTVQGSPIANHGDNEGWRKTRLRWLDSSIGNADEPTAPYVRFNYRNKRFPGWEERWSCRKRAFLNPFLPVMIRVTS